MTEKALEGLIGKLIASQAMQRQFLEMLVRRLVHDGPALDGELLLEHCYLLLQEAPRSPPPAAPGLEDHGHDELQKLIEMLERILAEPDGEPESPPRS